MDNYVGKRLDGRYEIREIIGVGGMSVVYKAYDNIDDRIVAVKILKEEFLANEEFRRRFKNESKAIAVLSHSNIVKVYDVSFGDRLQYIVMEYVEGITLKEYIEQQKIIPWKETLHFVIQILRALQHAHDKGIVHRDIKPQNIILLQNGNIKVTDFGIARFSRGETRSMTESAIGSVHYISPEQARGELTDDKADIYSVGIVLYEMLTGTLPFQGDSAVSVALMQVNDEPKRPHEINPEIPVGLEQITLRAMQKNTRDRYQSAAEMLLDLEEFKRNPLIKFDYTYFVDEEPTKYVDSFQTRQTRAVLSEEDENEADSAQSQNVKNRVLPIVAGVVFSLVIAAVIFIVIQLANNGTIFSGKKIEVMNFVGKNYLLEIKDKPEYTELYNFEVVYQSNSAFEPGTVFEQDPVSGQKITKGGTIKLSVVNESTSRQVPNVVGFATFAEAEFMLNEQGFNAIKVAVEDPSVTIGTVVRTSPEPGDSAAVGSTVTVYVSTEVQTDKVIVPKLTDSSLEAAKEIINYLGLSLGEIREENSSLAAGIVISQDPAENSEVTKNTKVNLVVSTGSPVSGSVDIIINLPNIGRANLEICVNDVFVGNPLTVYASGQTRAVTVSGSGSNNIVSIFIDDQKIYEAHVDFTTSPPEVTNEITYNYVTYIDVTGMEALAAKKRLNDAGFVNVSLSFSEDAPGNKGTVYMQSPLYASSLGVNSQTPITLYVVGSQEDVSKDNPFGF